MLQKHGGRVLVEFPDAALGDSDATCDESNTISHEVIRRLLHLYDGGDDTGYVEIDSDQTVDVEGEEVNLKRLAGDICQFSSGDGLSSRSLFFTSERKVELIRTFVSTREVPLELALEIRRVICPRSSRRSLLSTIFTKRTINSSFSLQNAVRSWSTRW